jgi:septal ring factor EnvC (AmiA/AmiB activator)
VSDRAHARPLLARPLPAAAPVAALLAALLAVAALLPLGAATADDRRGDLRRTQSRLDQVEGVLRDARADAAAVAAALAAADQAVADGRGRLAVAEARLAAARQRRLEASAALREVTGRVRDLQARLAEQVRAGYMTGPVAGLAAVIGAQSIDDLLERTATLNYVIAGNQDLLGQLQLARRQAALAHDGMVRAERERSDAKAQVAGELRELERVRSLRATAKRSLDVRVARLAGTAAALRAHSAELRRLIREEELARARQRAAGPTGPAAGSGGRCDLSGTSSAEHWIIMHESGGDPTADNPTSTAFGLGQLLLGNRILYLGRDYATTDCGKQLAAFRSYVRDRYGTAEAAKAFWQANGWY